MSKEELISKLHLLYTGEINVLPEIVNAYENLQQENKELKEQNESLKKYYEYDNKSWKNLAIKQAHDLEIKNNILTEFEKWLEEDFKNETEHPTPQIYCNCYSCKIKVLDKLQELKEGIK